jgi:hypothetical protein
MNNELKNTLKKDLQKCKLNLEIYEQKIKENENLINNLNKRNKKLENQIIINLQQYNNENKKRDEDIEFLLNCFAEMKNREAKEFDFITNTLEGLQNNVENVEKGLK